MGEVGEVLSPANDPGVSTSTSRMRQEWLKSDDLGNLHADDFLWNSGRSKEIIIRAGPNIMPGDVEAAGFALPTAADAATTAIPYPVLSEDVAALVVWRSDATASVGSLRESLLESRVTHRYAFVDALPHDEGDRVAMAQLVADNQMESAP
jgi:acyl-CoA synthetase (AMP-forming)/AMP-acid ligase II